MFRIFLKITNTLKIHILSKALFRVNPVSFPIIKYNMALVKSNLRHIPRFGAKFVFNKLHCTFHVVLV